MIEHEKATHQQTRNYNKQLVLRTIFDRGPVSRAEVARLTKLTPVSTSQMVSELLEEGLVAEEEIVPEEVTPGRRGRRPRMLQVAADGRHMVAIRLAVHEFRGAILNMRGEFVCTKTIPILEERGGEAVYRILDLLDDLFKQLARPLLGIGVASPGIVDPVEGVVRRSVFFDWNNLALGSLLQERYGAPAYVANASQTAALAEYLFSVSPRERNLAVVRVGQDVGVGLILEGQLYVGDGFGAGELGHLVVEEDGELCRCGNRGCLETLVSRQAIVRRARALAEAHPDSILARELETAYEVGLDAVLAAYRKGDPWAAEIAGSTAVQLGKAIAGIVTLTNVQRILFAGSVTQFGEKWLATISETMTRHAIPDLARQTAVEIAEHGADAVILGAAALLMSRELGLTLSVR